MEQRYHGCSGIYRRGKIVGVRLFGSTKIKPSEGRRSFPTEERAETFRVWAERQAAMKNLSLGGFLTMEV